MDLNSPNEPTQVLSMLSAFNTQMRHSTSGSRLSMTNTKGQSIKRSLATRLAFDETMEPESMRKVSRLDADLLSSSRHGLRRFTSENFDMTSKLSSDNEELRARLKNLEADSAGDRAKVASMETKMRALEMERDRDKVEWDRERGAMDRERLDNREKVDTLKFKLKQIKQRESDIFQDGFRSRKVSIDRAADLEVRLSKSRTENEQLSEELAQCRSSLAAKPDIDKFRYNQQIQDFKNKISDLESNASYNAVEMKRMQKKKAEGDESVGKLEDVTKELMMEKLKVDKLKGELEANQEAVIQRTVMREKLERYDELHTENIRLRSTNKLLTETAENAALLKEKLKQMEGDRRRMEARCQKTHEVSAELEVARAVNRDWGRLVADWVSAEDRDSLGLEAVAEVSVATARKVVTAWQERELAYVDKVNTFTHTEADLRTKLGAETEDKARLETEVTRVRQEQDGQARLVKKLQRKLLLVTKERDSFKGILESYEKEMTVTEDNVFQDKINALEKTNAEYKAMIDMLEEDRGEAAAPITVVDNSAELNELKIKIQSVTEKNLQLELELERRAIKGDFNPTDTKVIHFLNNPTSTAVEKRAAEMSELVKDNTALKARIQLLEEGQTKDLTLMVGAKVEEGEGEKVKELKVDLEKAEKREKRMMEAFKKTSKEFREVVAELTGYRIDVLSNNIYKLIPGDAETSEDNLMFQKMDDGEVCMLESDFSLELGELMEEHLEKHNSIPMFLAGIIRTLYFKKHGMTEDDVEEYNDGDEDDDMERDDNSNSSNSNNSSDPEEIIEIDDD